MYWSPAYTAERTEIRNYRPFCYILGSVDVCASHRCDFDGVCIVKSGRAHCECMDCTEEETELVCGTDGQTYSNPCHLRRTACELRQDIKLNYDGPCGELKNTCKKPYSIFLFNLYY